MTNDSLPGLNYEPERELMINDIESLKVYFDPMRLRIVQEIADRARSIHEIAEVLGVPFTRLYYHINLLEKHNIIKLVEVQRGVGAIEEKFYRVTARFYQVDRALTTPGTPVGDAGLETVLSMVLDQTRQSIMDGIAGEVLDLRQRVPHPNAMLIARGVYMMTPDLAQEFQLRIKELIIEFQSRQLNTHEGALFYNFAVALNPTVLLADDKPQDVDLLSDEDRANEDASHSAD